MPRLTIWVDVPDESDLRDVLNQAVEAVMGGNDPGTVMLSGMGEFTLSGDWPKDAEECLACGGNAFVLK